MSRSSLYATSCSILYSSGSIRFGTPATYSSSLLVSSTLRGRAWRLRSIVPNLRLMAEAVVVQLMAWPARSLPTTAVCLATSTARTSAVPTAKRPQSMAVSGMSDKSAALASMCSCRMAVRASRFTRTSFTGAVDPPADESSSPSPPSPSSSSSAASSSGRVAMYASASWLSRACHRPYSAAYAAAGTVALATVSDTVFRSAVSQPSSGCTPGVAAEIGRASCRERV